MPTYSAIALERLLETGASKPVDKPLPSSNYPVSRPLSKTNASSNLDRRNSVPTLERKPSRLQISPALYATPEATPLPDSPSSFSPSPYIINHKRRGPRLLKSSSENDMVSRENLGLDEDAVDGDMDVKKLEAKVVVDSLEGSTGPLEGKHVNVFNGLSSKVECVDGFHDSCAADCNDPYDGKIGNFTKEDESIGKSNGIVWEKDVMQVSMFDFERDVENDDFYDPRESMSCTSNTDVEDNKGAESSIKLAGSVQTVEFYDAWEELSSESGWLSSLRDIEAELREIRLNLLMEIEKRKHAEEALSSMLSQWQRIREQLAVVGLTLPASPVAAAEAEPSSELVEELCEQVYVTRFVANSLGRGTAKAEMEMEMEAQLEAKNFEIARLWDRLHYYEAMNHEMSQRNQEAVEMARRNRMVRKRRQRWVWGSIAAAVTLGTAALAWSYLAPNNGLSSSNAQAPDHEDGTE